MNAKVGIEVDALENAAVEALLNWLRGAPLISEDGRPLVKTDGLPVALDVLAVLAAVRRYAETLR